LRLTDEQLAGAIAEFPYNSQSLKRRIFTDPSLISTILKLVRHKPRKWIPNGKKIKIQAEEQGARKGRY
jgi:hypothetical protein